MRRLLSALALLPVLLLILAAWPRKAPQLHLQEGFTTSWPIENPNGPAPGSGSGAPQTQTGTLVNGQLVLSGFTLTPTSDVDVRPQNLVSPGQLSWTFSPSTGQVTIKSSSGTDGSTVLVIVK